MNSKIVPTSAVYVFQVIEVIEHNKMKDNLIRVMCIDRKETCVSVCSSIRVAQPNSFEKD